MNRARSYLLILGAYAVLAIIMTYPLCLNLTDSVPGDIGDPLLNTWILAWDGHALLQNPASLFDANIFFPRSNTLAYSEHMLSTALSVLPVQVAAGEPLAAYNLAFLARLALTGWATFLLAHRLTRSLMAAFLAGISFAFGPYHFAMFSHLQLLTLQWLPLSLLCLDRFLRERRSRLLAAFAFFLLLQLASSWYLAVFTTVVLAIYLIAYWLGPGRRAFRRTAPALGVALAVVIALTVPLVVPYLRAMPEMSSLRPLELRTSLSAQPRDLLIASRDNRIFGSLGIDHIGEVIEERQLFPGLIVPLSLAGLAFISLTKRKPSSSPADDGRWRAAALWILLGTSVALAAGPRAWIPGIDRWVTLPHSWLESLLPPLRLVRAPARWIIPASFAASLLFGFFLTSLFHWMRVKGLHRSWDWAAAASLLILLLLEGLSVPLPLARVGSTRSLSPVYPWLARNPHVAALVELPIHVAPQPEYPETRRMYASTTHWKALVNGYSGMTPRSHEMLGQPLSGFPSEEALETLVELGHQGVTHVVIHPREAPFPQIKWEEEWRWRIESGLDLLPVARWHDALVYRINPHGVDLLNPSREIPGSELGNLIVLPHRVNFADRIALVAYQMDHLEGQGPRLTLYWTRIGPLAEDYTVFVHVRDQQGRIVAQADGVPVEGHLPTSTWLQGEVFRDQHIFPQTIEASPRDIAVGLYLPHNMERLTTMDEEGNPADDHLILPWPQP
jgi:hypothetical protein